MHFDSSFYWYQISRSVSWLTVTGTQISQLDCFGWEEFVPVKFRDQKLLERALA